MHPNPAFRQTGTEDALTLVRARSFGVLAVSTESAPLLSHIPFLLSDDGTEAQLHLVRSNPICHACTGHTPATLVVSGPDGYISPDWYGIDDQVPTWNYLAAHLTGTLEPLPIDALEPLLAAQSAAYEARLSPKAPWTMDKMTSGTRARFLRMILPYRLRIAEVQSTFKLSQNKPEAARHGAAVAVDTGLGSDLGQLAQWMRHPPMQA